MRSVIVTTDSHKDLTSIHLARNLYVSEGEKLTQSEEHVLNQKIA